MKILAQPTWRWATFLGLLTSTSSAFDATTQWSWLDSSCDSKLDVLGIASQEYLDLADAAYNSLGDGIVDLTKSALKSFYGVTDAKGLFIQEKYNTLRKVGAGGSQIPYSIYCDGSAFVWTEIYLDCEREGETIPEGGQWYATRSDPEKPPLYIPGTKADSFCTTTEGEEGNAASPLGGSSIILCPGAFKKRKSLASVKDVVQPVGTNLDNMVSIGSILLHEMTHCTLSSELLLPIQSHFYSSAS
ncbi:uncharacterized protein N7459_006819 [Penicillium hispanicum]|uniref:uncharacterized protein n=1 Tax=Penicillium hispanicum TaxID=1080232 RepID=UPI002540749F|nr:uncharacterized protein N7459_006819 [Penicillium hispanicum]KAJ5577855.1 hypothetical protein N7459_006819 [Penicillium hispanicum]